MMRVYKERDLKKQKGRKEIMNKILNFVEEKLAPPLNKMANQHHLNAVKNGMMVTVPLTIIGSIFLLIPNIPIDFIKSFLNLMRP